MSSTKEVSSPVVTGMGGEKDNCTHGLERSMEMGGDSNVGGASTNDDPKTVTIGNEVVQATDVICIEEESDSDDNTAVPDNSNTTDTIRRGRYDNTAVPDNSKTTDTIRRGRLPDTDSRSSNKGKKCSSSRPKESVSAESCVVIDISSDEEVTVDGQQEAGSSSRGQANDITPINITPSTETSIMPIEIIPSTPIEVTPSTRSSVTPVKVTSNTGGRKTPIKVTHNMRGASRIIEITPIEAGNTHSCPYCGECFSQEALRKDHMADCPRMTPAEKAANCPRMTPAEKAANCPRMTPAEKAANCPRMTPAEKAANCPRMTSAEKVSNCPRMTPAEKAANCPRMTPAEKASGVQQSLVQADADTGEQYDCRLCERNCVSEEGFMKHLNKSHRTAELVFRCTVCRQVFPNLTSTKAHVHVHFKHKSHQCACGKKFPTTYEFEEHKKICYERKCSKQEELHLEAYSEEDDVPEGPHKCAQCGWGFETQRQLKSHTDCVRVLIEMVFQCDVCEEVFPRQNLVVAHLQSHMASKPRVCCGEEFVWYDLYIKHTQTHSLRRHVEPGTAGASITHPTNHVEPDTPRVSVTHPTNHVEAGTVPANAPVVIEPTCVSPDSVESNMTHVSDPVVIEPTHVTMHSTGQDTPQGAIVIEPARVSTDPVQLHSPSVVHPTHGGTNTTEPDITQRGPDITQPGPDITQPGRTIVIDPVPVSSSHSVEQDTTLIGTPIVIDPTPVMTDSSEGDPAQFEGPVGIDSEESSKFMSTLWSTRTKATGRRQPSGSEGEKADLTVHMDVLRQVTDRYQAGSREQSPTASAALSYSCSKCTNTFPWANQLTEHMKTHEQLEQPEQKPPKRKQPLGKTRTWTLKKGLFIPNDVSKRTTRTPGPTLPNSQSILSDFRPILPATDVSKGTTNMSSPPVCPSLPAAEVAANDSTKDIEAAVVTEGGKYKVSSSAVSGQCPTPQWKELTSTHVYGWTYEHPDVVQQDEQYKCLLCNVLLPTPHRIYRHMETHTNKTPAITPAASEKGADPQEPINDKPLSIEGSNISNISENDGELKGDQKSVLPDQRSSPSFDLRSSPSFDLRSSPSAGQRKSPSSGQEKCPSDKCGSPTSEGGVQAPNFSVETSSSSRCISPVRPVQLYQTYRCSQCGEGFSQEALLTDHMVNCPCVAQAEKDSDVQQSTVLLGGFVRGAQNCPVNDQRTSPASDARKSPSSHGRYVQDTSKCTGAEPEHPDQEALRTMVDSRTCSETATTEAPSKDCQEALRTMADSRACSETATTEAPSKDCQEALRTMVDSRTCSETATTEAPSKDCQEALRTMADSRACSETATTEAPSKDCQEALRTMVDSRTCSETATTEAPSKDCQEALRTMADSITCSETATTEAPSKDCQEALRTMADSITCSETATTEAPSKDCQEGLRTMVDSRTCSKTATTEAPSKDCVVTSSAGSDKLVEDHMDCVFAESGSDVMYIDISPSYSDQTSEAPEISASSITDDIVVCPESSPVCSNEETPDAVTAIEIKPTDSNSAGTEDPSEPYLECPSSLNVHPPHRHTDTSSSSNITKQGHHSLVSRSSGRGYNRYTCTVCQQQHSDISSMARHMVTAHGSIKPKMCFCCGLSGYFKPNELEVHQQMHVETPTCYRCDVQCTDVAQLKEHFKLLHTEEQHTCLHCKTLVCYNNLNDFRHHLISKHSGLMQLATRHGKHSVTVPAREQETTDAGSPAGTDAEEKQVDAKQADCDTDNVGEEADPTPDSDSVVHPPQPTGKGSVKRLTRQIHCTECNLEFWSISEMSRHLVSHFDKGTPKTLNKQITCTQCDLEFWSIQEMSRHLMSHFSQLSNCKDCGVRFRTREAACMHDISKAQCPQCKTMFCSGSQFSAHRESCKPGGSQHTTHASGSTQPTTGDSGGAWHTTGDSAGTQYTTDNSRGSGHTTDDSRSSLVTTGDSGDAWHTTGASGGTHHTTAASGHTKITPQANSPNKKAYDCVRCDRTFSSFLSLQSHMYVDHRIFKCTVCSRSFDDLETREEHMRGRHGVMYSCSQCDAVFHRSEELERHVDTHSQDMPDVTVPSEEDKPEASPHNSNESTKESDNQDSSKTLEKPIKQSNDLSRQTIGPESTDTRVKKDSQCRPCETRNEAVTHAPTKSDSQDETPKQTSKEADRSLRAIIEQAFNQALGTSDTQDICQDTPWELIKQLEALLRQMMGQPPQETLDTPNKASCSQPANHKADSPTIDLTQETYTCHVCDKVVETIDDLNGHLVFHIHELKHKCLLCPQAFKSSTDLDVHLQSQHSAAVTPPKTSETPPKTSETPPKTSETPPKTSETEKSVCFMCLTCGERFADGSILMEHVMLHVFKYYQCCFCQRRRFVNQHECAAHEMYLCEKRRGVRTLNEGYPCNMCGKWHSCQKSLKTHLAATHYSKLPLDTNVPGSQPRPTSRYKCEQCGDVFNMQKALSFHEYGHIKQWYNITNMTPYTCFHCNKVFMVLDSLMTHLSRYHSQTSSIGKETYHKCQQCTERCSDEFQLNLHMSVHRPGYGANGSSQGAHPVHTTDTETGVVPGYPLDQASSGMGNVILIQPSGNSTQETYHQLSISSPSDQQPSAGMSNIEPVLIEPSSVATGGTDGSRSGRHEQRVSSCTSESDPSTPDTASSAPDAGSGRVVLIQPTPGTLLTCKLCVEEFHTTEDLNRHLRFYIHDNEDKSFKVTAAAADIVDLTQDGVQNNECSGLMNEPPNPPNHPLNDARPSTSDSPPNECSGLTIEPPKPLKRPLSDDDPSTSDNPPKKVHTDCVLPIGLYAHRQFQCSLCDRSFEKRSGLNRHMRTHEKSGNPPKEVHTDGVLPVGLYAPREFRCSLCYRSFEKRSGLNRHMRTHERDPLILTVGTTNPNTRTVMVSPLDTTPTVKMSAIDTTPAVRMSPIDTTPAVRMSPIDTTPAVRPSPIDTTPAVKTSHINATPAVPLSTAVSSSSSSTAVVTPITITPTAATPDTSRPAPAAVHHTGYQCSACGVSYNSRVVLEKHIKLHTKERPYVCSHCGTRFTQPATLTRHVMVLHPGRTAYTCYVCPDTFMWIDALNMHMATHTDGSTDTKPTHLNRDKLSLQPKPTHKCEECGETFSKENDLTNHVLGHLKVWLGKPPMRIHKCELCGKTFSKEEDLTTHVLEHRTKWCEDPKKRKCYKCGHCGKYYSTEGSLTCHQLSQHSGPVYRERLVSRSKSAISSTLTPTGQTPSARVEPPVNTSHTKSAASSTVTAGTPTGQTPQVSTAWVERRRDYPAPTSSARVERLHTGRDYSMCGKCVQGFLCVTDLEKHISTHAIIPSLSQT